MAAARHLFARGIRPKMASSSRSSGSADAASPLRKRSQRFNLERWRRARAALTGADGTVAAVDLQEERTGTARTAAGVDLGEREMEWQLLDEDLRVKTTSKDKVAGEADPTCDTSIRIHCPFQEDPLPQPVFVRPPKSVRVTSVRNLSTDASGNATSADNSSEPSHNSFAGGRPSAEDARQGPAAGSADQSQSASRLPPREWRDTGFARDRAEGKPSTRSRRALELTIVSYNVLADNLMKMHRGLYQGATEEDVSWSSRYPRLLSQLTSFDADILCLQEVQHDHFEPCFERDLRALGYSGVYKRRTGDKADGCAIFYKEDKLLLEDHCSLEYRQPGVHCLDRDNVALLARFRVKFDGSTATGRGRGAEQRLVVANTHLLYNPNRQDVKLAQSVLLMAELDRFATPFSRRRLPCIVTGDFNLGEESPVFNFLTGGSLVYQGLFSRQLAQVGNGKVLGPALIPRDLGITEHCKHIDVLRERCLEAPQKTKDSACGFVGENRLFHSDNKEDEAKSYLGKRYSFEQDDDVAKRLNLPRSPFESGRVQHDLGLRSVHKHPRALGSTRQERWLAVDHMFYTTRYSSSLRAHVEDASLRLLSRLELPRARDCERSGLRLPDRHNPSDHLPIVARFLITARD